MSDEVYQLRVVCEECDQEIGSVSAVVTDTPSGVFWALHNAGMSVGDLIRRHKAQQRVRRNRDAG